MTIKPVSSGKQIYLVNVNFVVMKNVIQFSIYFAVFIFLYGCRQNEPVNTTPTKETATSPTPSDKVPAASDRKNILFYGNSLTAAYGLDPSEGFAGLIQQKIDSLDLNYKVINAGLSGETTEGGLSRIDWVLSQNDVDIFILELGGNDGLRGLDLDNSYENLEGIIQKVKSKYPDVKIVLAGMEAPPNMGQTFTSKFRKMYPDLAKKHEAALIPFLLDGVGGIPELNLPDGIHPNVEGHKIVAENIWKVLEPML